MRLNIFKTFSEWRAQRERAQRKTSPDFKVGDSRQHKGWGNNIEIFDWHTRKVCGWTEPLPVNGDELLLPMKSGRIGRFEFVRVEPCCDPPDMWFAVVSEIGYL